MFDAILLWLNLVTLAMSNFAKQLEILDGFPRVSNVSTELNYSIRCFRKGIHFFFKLTRGHWVIFCFFNVDRNFYSGFNQIVIVNCIRNINRRIPTIWYTLLRFHCKIDINCYERFIGWIIELFNGNSGSLNSDKIQIFSFAIFNKLLSTKKTESVVKQQRRYKKYMKKKRIDKESRTNLWK